MRATVGSDRAAVTHTASGNFATCCLKGMHAFRHDGRIMI